MTTPATIPAEPAPSADCAQLRARRYLLLAAASFLTMPADIVLHTWITGYQPRMPGVAIASLLPMAMLIWAARVVTRPDFESQALVRSIAVSNMVVALLLAISVGGVIGAFGQILIAGSCYAVLRLLDQRGLEASEAESSFQPVAFRGFLVLALVMAFADAQTLMFSSLVHIGDLWSNESLQTVATDMFPTFIAALIMALNVWGLLRLKTWAMLLNIVANIAIARMALDGVLQVNSSVAAALATTAAIQLFLPVPILATVLGDREAGGAGWAPYAKALRLCVPLVVALTMAKAIDHVGFNHLWGWDVDGVSRTVQRGLPQHVQRIDVRSQVRRSGLRYHDYEGARAPTSSDD